MPIYEYRCRSCRRHFSVLHRSFNAVATVACDHCGGTDILRLVSRVAVLRSQESRRQGRGDDAALAGLDEDDPKSLARWARQMGRELGDEAGPEWDEMVDRMEQGELPDEGGDDGGLGPADADSLP